MIGEYVESYEVLEELGRGGMGVVYRAHDRRLRRDVALKVLHPERMTDPARQRRFLREARTVSSLAHPGIVTIFDIVQHGDSDVLVMELVKGESLRVRITAAGETGSGMPWPRAAEFGLQIADALGAAHRAGVVHRDLKPENVMVDASERIKILDFGIAKLDPRFAASESSIDLETLVSDPGQDPQVALGTLAYMAPEQALAEPIDARTDVFAFGILAYEMLAGHRPFQGAAGLGLVHAILYDSPSPLPPAKPEIPTELVDLIFSCLEKRPEERPGDLGKVAEALRLFSDSSGSASALVLPAHFPLSSPPSTGGYSGVDGITTEASPRYRPTLAPPETSSPEASSPEASTPETSPPETSPPETSPPETSPPETSSSGPALPYATTPGLGQPPSEEAVGQLGRRVGLGAGLVAALLLVLWGFEGFPWRSLGTQAGADLVEEPAADPHRPASSSAHDLYRQGRHLLDRYDRSGNIDAAIDVLSRALERDGEMAVVYAALAEAHCRQFVVDNADPLVLERAASHAEKAVTLGDFLASSHRSAARVALLQGNPEAALEALDRAQGLEPRNAETFILRGSAQEKMGRLDAAEAAYRAAVEIDGGNREAHDSLGSLYFRRGLYAEAQAAFEHSIEVAPDSYIGHRNLAGALQMRGRYWDAAAALQRSLEIRPTPSSFSNLGTLRFFSGLYGDAVRAYERAIELGANDYMIWGNLGDAYRHDPPHRDEAPTAYQRAIQLARRQMGDEGDPQTRSRIALFLAKAGNPTEALDELELLPTDGRDVAMLGRVLLVLELSGERQRALELLPRLLELGYPAEALASDPDLLELRQDPRYHKIVARSSL